jgi:hypothetical protein
MVAIRSDRTTCKETRFLKETGFLGRAICHIVSLLAVVSWVPSMASADDEATQRAVAYLVREVPAWQPANNCFSCHNNGDGARALLAALHAGFDVPDKALAASRDWLAQPDRWDHNKGDPGFSDKRLANIQFAASLLAAIEAGHVKDRRPLQEAARKVAADQGAEGAWPIEPGNAVGSPATYGTTLATYLACRTLEQAAAPETKEALGKAQAWLGRAQPDNVLAAATLLLAAAGVERCLDVIRQAQSHDGGWGPYADSPPEPFDTAVVLLALAEWREAPGVQEMIQRGREFLVAQQNPDGGWPATTRPPGGESYAQRISTTAWATLALLGTRHRN